MSYLIRVDDRLIHGQVIEGWTKPLKITLIVICSDIVYADIMQKTLFSLSVPANVKLECNSLYITAENIINKKYDSVNTLILLSSLDDLLKLIEIVRSKNIDIKIPPINIGGLRHCGSKKQIYKAMCLDNADIELIKKILSMNVKLEYYLLPTDPKIDLSSVLKDIENNIKI